MYSGGGGTPSFKFGFAKTATTMEASAFHYNFFIIFWDLKFHKDIKF